MLIVMKSTATEVEIDKVVVEIEKNGFTAHISKGDIHTVIGAVGGKTIDTDNLELLDGVEKILRITSNYKLASRTFHPDNTIIQLKNCKIGSDKLEIMAGPCSIEGAGQMDELCDCLSKMGVKILRGGAFKPRTSPYSFQGLGEDGLKMARNAADKYGMCVISEVMEISQIPMLLEYTDILQVGARNMQNFNLLKELGHINKPVLLKRGLCATIEEWLMSAEYIMSGGNMDIILCERGIRTYETSTRNTLDISAIPVVKKLSHLPIVADPSHASGMRDKVAPLSRACVAAGADGLIIEVHNNPDKALCDGAQSLYPQQFAELYPQLQAIANAVNRTL